MSSNRNVHEKLVEVLETINEQYDATVEFCNAQTRLLNALTKPSGQQSASDAGASNLHLVLQDYNTCLRHVHNIRERVLMLDSCLQSKHSEYNKRIASVCKAHTERADRVLQTVQQAGGGVWSSHGIPLSENDTNTVMVALATLRASVDTVRDVLAPYFKD